MKILIDLTSLYDHISGIERYAMEISLSMIDTHRENTYVLIFKNEMDDNYRKRLLAIRPDFSDDKKIDIHILKTGKGIFGSKLVFSQIRLPLFLYGQKADAYMFMAFPEPLLFFSSKIYTTVHDMSPWECADTMKWMSKWYFRLSWGHAFMFAKRILTVSKFSGSRIMKIANVRKGRLWLIRDGISGKRASQADIQRAKEKYNLPDRYIMTLSTIEPRKNMQLLVRAYSELVEEGYDFPDLVLVGRNGWKNSALFDGCSRKVREHIHMPGFIDNDETVGVYGGAELFVFPSIYEGFGMPPLEAMKAGCVVVSSDAASMPEVLEDSAIYFKSQDLEDLKRKMVYALELDVIRRNEYMVAGYAQAEKFNWDKEADKLCVRLEALHHNL